MESEIKLAWVQGYRAALTHFTMLYEPQITLFAEMAWAEWNEELQRPWNERRIEHRDQSNSE